MLVVSPKFNCSNEILTITAMLDSAAKYFLRPRHAQQAADEAKARLSHVDGDHLTLLNVFHAWKHNAEDPDWCYASFIDVRALMKADNVRSQLVRITTRYNLKECSRRSNSSQDYSVNIRKALLAGYFMQVAHLDQSTGRYVIVKDNEVTHVHASCALDCKPEWVMYGELILTNARGNYIRNVTEVRGEWLIDIAPRYYDFSNLPRSEARNVLQRLYLKREREQTEANLKTRKRLTK